MWFAACVCLRRSASSAPWSEMPHPGSECTERRSRKIRHGLNPTKQNAVYDLQTKALVCKLLSTDGPYCFFSLLFHPCCTLLYSDDGKRHWQSSQRTISTHLQQLPDANSHVKIQHISRKGSTYGYPPVIEQIGCIKPLKVTPSNVTLPFEGPFTVPMCSVAPWLRCRK